jgi:chitodextrinase
VIPPVGGQVPPGFGTLVNATVPTNGTVAVNWIPVPNTISYNVYTTSAATPLNLQVTSRVPQSLGGAPVTQTVLAGLTPGQAYLIQVRAADANGIETVVPIASPQGGPGGPTLPTGPLSVSSATANSVALTWTALPGAVSYRVLQGSSAAGPFVVSTGGTTTTTSATVTGLSPNTTYFFQVVPVDQLGNQGPPTNVVSASTNLTLPAPGNLSLVTATGSMAVLSWGASPGATAYRVLQSQLPGGPFVVVNPASLTTSGATIVNLTPNTTYYYQVVALDASGNQSVASNTITVVTGAP